MKITFKQIDDCFSDVVYPVEPLIALYRLVFPDWDKIQSVNGWPKVSENLSRSIWSKFIRLKDKFPDCWPAGMWLNNGFSEDPNLPDFTIHPCEVTLAQE